MSRITLDIFCQARSAISREDAAGEALRSEGSFLTELSFNSVRYSKIWLISFIEDLNILTTSTSKTKPVSGVWTVRTMLLSVSSPIIARDASVSTRSSPEKKTQLLLWSVLPYKFSKRDFRTVNSNYFIILLDFPCKKGRSPRYYVFYSSSLKSKANRCSSCCSVFRSSISTRYVYRFGVESWSRCCCIHF